MKAKAWFALACLAVVLLGMKAHGVFGSAEVVRVDGVAVLVSAPANGSGDMGITGELAVVGDGRCLGIRGLDGSQTLVFWPSGTTFRTIDDTITVSRDGDTYRLGDQIDVGGQDASRLSTGDDFWDDTPASCRTLDTVSVGYFS